MLSAKYPSIQDVFSVKGNHSAWLKFGALKMKIIVGYCLHRRRSSVHLFSSYPAHSSASATRPGYANLKEPGIARSQ